MVSPTPTVFRHQDTGTSPQGESCFQNGPGGQAFGTYLNHEHFPGVSAGAQGSIHVLSSVVWLAARWVRSKATRSRSAPALASRDCRNRRFVGSKTAGAGDVSLHHLVTVRCARPACERPECG